MIALSPYLPILLSCRDTCLCIIPRVTPVVVGDTNTIIEPTTLKMIVDGKLCATGEFMVLHYSTRDSRTIEMPELVQTALKQAEVTEKPDWIGRQIGLKKR